jgi:hypothetical protein
MTDPFTIAEGIILANVIQFVLFPLAVGIIYTAVIVLVTVCAWIKKAWRALDTVPKP